MSFSIIINDTEYSIGEAVLLKESLSAAIDEYIDITDEIKDSPFDETFTWIVPHIGDRR